MEPNSKARSRVFMLRTLIGFAALLAFAAIAKAGPFEDSIYGTPAEARWAPFHANLGNVPACDDPSVLDLITSRFSETENTYWGGVHAIDGYENVRDIGFRVNGLD